MVRKRTKYAAFGAVLVAVFGPAAVTDLFGAAAGRAAAVVVAGGAGVGFAAAGIAGVLFGGTSLRLGFALRGRDADTAVDVADGDRVYLEGPARPHEEMLTAPFTGEDCLAYSYAIQWQETVTTTDQNASDGATDRETKTVWRDITDGRVAVPFELEVGGGTVLVDDDGLTPLLDDDETTIVVGPDETPPERVRAFLDDPAVAAPPDESVDLPAFDRDQKLRYRETLLLPGEDVFVMGEGTTAQRANLGPGTEVDGVVGPSTRDGYRAAILDRLPEEVYPFGFSVSDKPMDETLRGMRWGGGFMLVLALLAFGVSGIGFGIAAGQLGLV